MPDGDNFSRVVVSYWYYCPVCPDCQMCLLGWCHLWRDPGVDIVPLLVSNEVIWCDLTWVVGLCVYCVKCVSKLSMYVMWLLFGEHFEAVKSHAGSLFHSHSHFNFSLLIQYSVCRKICNIYIYIIYIYIYIYIYIITMVIIYYIIYIYIHIIYSI